MIFWGFCWKKGKNNFGLGDEAKFLQSSSWGREGNGYDVLDSMNGWKILLRSSIGQEGARILFKLTKTYKTKQKSKAEHQQINEFYLKYSFV